MTAAFRRSGSYGNIRFSQLPGGLITSPTLEWLLDSPARGSQETRISYETRGMTWWADYNIIYDESEDCSMDLSAWVSIINQSGASYDDAKLKLIAGDVNRAERKQPRRDVVYKMADGGRFCRFRREVFFRIPPVYAGQAHQPAGQLDQADPADAGRQGIQCEKELVFAPTMDMPYYGYQQFDQEYGRYGNGDVNVYLRFSNERSQQLGIPLPAGRIRVNQVDPADGSLEFIGEDVMDHTPRNEDVLIEMGNAFDVVGERKQTDFRVDLGPGTCGKPSKYAYETTRMKRLKSLCWKICTAAPTGKLNSQPGHRKKTATASGLM